MDLPEGEKEPSKDQVAFLKNLTRHMLGEGGAEDTQLLDNLITEAILRTYKRAAIRPSIPIPTFSDLRDELSQWRDEEKNQRVMDEAHLAAIQAAQLDRRKRSVFEAVRRPTTISLDNPWLFFNVEQLSDDRRLETAMSLLIAHATAQRAAGKAGRRSITVLDECCSCWILRSWHPKWSNCFVRRASACERLGNEPNSGRFCRDGIEAQAARRGIVKNSNTKIIGQQPGDMTACGNTCT